MPRLARHWLLPAAAAVVLGAGSAPARAHDAPMPNDARHGLLVNEPWVMNHWSPFDEREAERALALRPGQLAAFLYNDHHTLAQLARHRGIGFERLVHRLAAWSERTPGADPQEIRQRVRLMLVSGHLAQHVFGHVFHGLSLGPILTRGVELPQQQFAQRRAEGRSYRGLVRQAGGDPAAVQYELSLALRRNERRGVRRHQTPPAQSARLAGRQRDSLHCWFTRPAQLVDPAAPYGRTYLKHVKGHTASEIPATAAAQTIEDRAIDAALDGRPSSCWTLPERFDRDPGPPLTRRELRRLAQVPAGFKGPVNDALDHPGADEHAGH